MLTLREFKYWDRRFKSELGIPFRPIAGGKGRSKKRKQAEERALEPQRQLERAAALTPEETQRRELTFSTEQQLSDLLRMRAGIPGEELMRQFGPVSRGGLDLAQRAVSDPESFFFADVFNPQLKLVQDMINAQSARRGIAPASGLALESLGRAGIDLSIQDALQRQQARLLGLQTGQDVARFASGEQTGARGELFDFLANLQNLSEGARQRALTGTQARAGIESGIHGAQAERLGGPNPFVKFLADLTLTLAESQGAGQPTIPGGGAGETELRRQARMGTLGQGSVTAARQQYGQPSSTSQLLDFRRMYGGF